MTIALKKVDVANTQKIFKLEVVHQLNKPVAIRAWADCPISNLSVDGNNLNCSKSEMVDRRCVSHFCLNENYKSQLKGELMDFICLGFSFQPDYIVHYDRVAMVDGVGAQYHLDAKNITKVQYKENIYKEVKIEFEPTWDYSFENFASVRGQIATYDVEKLRKKIPNCGDFKKIRVLDSKLNERACELVVDGGNLYKLSICDIALDYQYFCNIVRSQSLIIEAVRDNGVATKNIEYKFRVPYKPGLKNWSAGVQYYKFDIVWHDNAAFRAKKDNIAHAFDINAWDKINKKQYLSFNHDFSFFESVHGARCFEKIKMALPFIIEKNLGDCVTLMLVDSNAPSLNDWFDFNGKKFRVVKYTQHRGTFDFVEIVGQEILATDFASGNFAGVEFKTDDMLPDSSYDIISAQKTDVDGKFEGVVINTLEDVTVASNAVLKIKIGK